jgi:hypothetical protein
MDENKYQILKSAADKAYEIWLADKSNQNTENLSDANEALIKFLGTEKKQEKK